MSETFKKKLMELSSEVSQFGNIFLKSKGITYFEHARVYKNGLSFRIINDPNITTYFLNHKFALPDPSIYPKTGVFVWSGIEGLDDFDSQSLDLRSKFNIDHGVCFAMPNSNYLEMFDFAASCGCVSNINYCINNAQEIYTFCNRYLEKFNRVFQHIDNYLTIFPLRPNSFSAVSKKITEFSTITKREVECLSLLTNGNTAKMSARILDISPRTVERHIENVKTKLNIHYRSELIRAFLEWKRLNSNNT